MPPYSSVFTAAVLFLAAAPEGVAGSGIFPEAVEGWERSGPDRVYTADTLYEHIDGAAEIYLAFNVRGVVSRRYSGEGGFEIIADLFDMGSASEAFGAYHFDTREGEDAGIGRESELVGSSLAFWKDRYFVSIIPLAESPLVRKAVLSLGAATAAAIAGDAPPPDLAGHLPREGLIASRIHYFHDWAILDLLTDFGNEDPFALHGGTEGVIGRYRADPDATEKPASLVLVRYPSDSEARAALESLAGRLPKTGDVAAARRRGSIIAAVIGAPSEESAGALLDAAVAGLPAAGEGGE